MKKPLKWQIDSIKKKGRKLCDKVRKRMANRQEVTNYYAPSDKEEHPGPTNRPEGAAGDPADHQASRPETIANDAWDPPKVVVGKDARKGYHAITHQHWLGPDDMRLREVPSTKQSQALLKFAGDEKLFPVELLEASAEDHYNFARDDCLF